MAKTLISGHAGVAVVLDGKRATAFHVDGPANHFVPSQEIHRLFEDAPDIIEVQDLRADDVPARLELEWSKSRCLLLVLLLLGHSALQDSARDCR